MRTGHADMVGSAVTPDATQDQICGSAHTINRFSAHPDGRFLQL